MALRMGRTLVSTWARLDGAGEAVQGQVVRIVAEGVLDLDGQLLDAQHEEGGERHHLTLTLTLTLILILTLTCSMHSTRKEVSDTTGIMTQPSVSTSVKGSMNIQQMQMTRSSPT